MSQISEIIKYEGDNSTFIWKHPCEDFNIGTQLIVHESQEAIFYMNGQALDLFGVGRHTLETENIPLIKRILNRPTGDKTPFHCEVYFINKTEQMAIRWGTDSKVQYIEPLYRFPIYIGASGEMTLSVKDSRKLLVNIVGTERTLEQKQLVAFFRALLMTKVKTYIAQTMKDSSINIFEIDEHLENFSAELKERLVADFSNYGVNLKQFFVSTIVKPDGDPTYEKFKDLHYRQYAEVAEAQLQQRVGIIEQQTEAQRLLIESKGIAEKRATEGYTYQQERGFDVAEKVASNEGSGNFSSAGIGLGMMAGIGSTVSDVFHGSFPSLETTNISFPNRFCDTCGVDITSGAAFCDNCGTQLNRLDICSNCGFEFLKPGKFCPKCGSKREG